MHFHFDQYVQEAQTYLNELGRTLGHEEDQASVERLLRACLHTLRDRISVSESLDLLAQLPLFFKGVYVDQWHYQEHIDRYDGIDEFCARVKKRQEELGEEDFGWPEPTEELVRRVFQHLGQRIDSPVLAHVQANLPQNLKPLLAPAVG